MTGAAATEIQRRTLRQLVGEGLYRFADNKLYVGGRYNTVNGELAGIPNDITVKRSQVGGGWFVTPNVLSKIEFVRQNYDDFPTHRHPQRWQVPGLHGRGRRRLLTTSGKGERGSARSPSFLFGAQDVSWRR